jgi:hypothetical protein
MGTALLELRDALLAHSSGTEPPLPAATSPGALYFAKHRLGVKGRAVHPMREAALLAWLHGEEPAKLRDYVVQAEVAPPALWEGRKFTVRCHALIALCPPPNELAAWLHRDVIILPHAKLHEFNGADRAVHVSQAGRNHPQPTLSSEVPTAHPAAACRLWPRLLELITRCLASCLCELLPPSRCSTSTLYSLMAFDLALDANGRPFVLEVNSHPAIGDGSMSAVDTGVYTRLVADVTSLLVLPAAVDVDVASGRAATGTTGGFESLPLLRS